jgi:dTDP-4-amino-4,6-dideoxygalactose transaminase
MAAIYMASEGETHRKFINKMSVPFNIAPLAGREMELIADALQHRHLSGDGPYTKLCQQWLQTQVGTPFARLVHSCTAALEMAVILADVGVGDEVIMPSFTFVSTANAVALRGGVPVFVDIRPDTLNIDEAKIEAAVTSRTKAIIVVHYAGVCADMTAIAAIARRHGLLLIEDAAQALGSFYDGTPAGRLSDFSCFSFHETKNIVSGEGGALLVNSGRFCDRADIIREKGTNRTAFHNGIVDKYTWIDIGSSYLPSEITAAFLWAQLQSASEFTSRRLDTWNTYHRAFLALEETGAVRRPIIPTNCQHNGHLYYLLTSGREQRDALVTWLRTNDINAPFHYIPLHSSPAGRRLSRSAGSMDVTDHISDCLIRLPMFLGVEEHQAEIIKKIHQFFQA